MSNEKRSKNPGDDKAMIVSRKNFLERGYYKKISETLNNIILEDIKSKNLKYKIEILDVGCGEGYYTNLLGDELNNKEIKNHIVGVDISKDGIIHAARSYKGIEWIVASGSKLPIQDNSLDYVICMFSYIDPIEYRRVLKKDGKLIIVSAGEYHLVEIKKVVYEKLKMEYYRPTEDIKEGYTHEKLVNVKYKTEIKNNIDIKSLFDMTPYRWKSPKDGVERLFQLEELGITVDVNVDVFKAINN
jgi:23S rRNA (guanine745-N1)-methyltransferase